MQFPSDDDRGWTAGRTEGVMIMIVTEGGLHTTQPWPEKSGAGTPRKSVPARRPLAVYVGARFSTLQFRS